MKLVKVLSICVVLLALGGCATDQLGFGCCESVAPVSKCCD